MKTRRAAVITSAAGILMAGVLCVTAVPARVCAAETNAAAGQTAAGAAAAEQTGKGAEASDQAAAGTETSSAAGMPISVFAFSIWIRKSTCRVSVFRV